jgi:hypothetical protein
MKSRRLILIGVLGILLASCSRQSVAEPAPEGRAAAPVPNQSKPLAVLVQKTSAGSAQKDSGQPAEGFPFPDDKGGKLVAKALEPGEKPGSAAHKTSGPKSFPAASFLENPALPLKPYTGGLPKIDWNGPGRPVRPRHLAEEVPLVSYRGAPNLPAVPALPAGPLVRLQSPDPNEVPPLPLLARPVPDRASLADPTVEASSAAALANSIPVRTQPAPFVRLNLPDPFEHHHAVRVRTPPSEDAVPPLVAPRTPLK